jgi:uracil phosphoribosyltransferase
MIDKYDEFPNLNLVRHPLLAHKLSYLRDKESSPDLLRRKLKEIANILAIHATENLKLKVDRVRNFKDQIIETEFLEESEIVIAPILRSGLVMADALSDLIPSARIAHIGMYRDREKSGIINYLVSMPDVDPLDISNFLILDPIMATGMTVMSALDEILSFGVKKESISVINTICSTNAISEFYSNSNFFDIEIYTAAIDPELDDDLYVVPGMGDAGDRLFGTEA